MQHFVHIRLKDSAVQHSAQMLSHGALPCYDVLEITVGTLRGLDTDLFKS